MQRNGSNQGFRDNGENLQNSPRPHLPPGALVILPLRNGVLFPSTVMPLVVGRPASIRAVEEAIRQQQPVGIVGQRDPKVEALRGQDLFDVGTTADVLRIIPLTDGQHQVVVQGRQRFKIVEFLQTDSFIVARTTLVEEKVPQTREFEARIIRLRDQATRSLSLLPQPMHELRATIESIEDPLALMDIIASTLDLSAAEKQEILATMDVEARAQKITAHLARQIELLELSKKIGTETRESMDKTQR